MVWVCGWWREGDVHAWCGCVTVGKGDVHAWCGYVAGGERGMSTHGVGV